LRFHLTSAIFATSKHEWDTFYYKDMYEVGLGYTDYHEGHIDLFLS